MAAENSCRVMETVKYAIVHNYGPKAEDETRYLSVTGTGTRTDYYVDIVNGHKTFNSSSYRVTGSEIQNNCAYTIDLTVTMTTTTERSTLFTLEKSLVNRSASWGC